MYGKQIGLFKIVKNYVSAIKQESCIFVQYKNIGRNFPASDFADLKFLKIFQNLVTPNTRAVCIFKGSF